MERSEYIGGSDIASVMGLSRWKTPLQLWAEKTGNIPQEDLSDKEYIELGSELEDFIAKKFEKKTGLKVRQAPCHYKDKEYDFMRCQVDRLITNTDELLECKNASAWKEKEWKGEDIPIEYVLQVSWQLMITGRKVGWIAVLIGGNKFRFKKIEADQELFDKMRQSAIKFWDMVKDKTPPAASEGDDEVLVALYPQSSEIIKEADENLNEALAHYLELSLHISAMEKDKNEIKASIMQTIADSKGIKTSKYKVLRIDIASCEYVVKRKASWYPRIYLNKGE